MLKSMASPEERAPRFPENNSTETGINNLTYCIKQTAPFSVKTYKYSTYERSRSEYTVN